MGLFPPPPDLDPNMMYDDKDQYQIIEEEAVEHQCLGKIQGLGQGLFHEREKRSTVCFDRKVQSHVKYKVFV